MGSPVTCARAITPFCTTYRGPLGPSCVTARSYPNSARQAPGLPRPVGKNGLGHVLRQVRIASHRPPRRRINHVDVPVHDLPESRLGTVFNVLAQQSAVVIHRLSNLSEPARKEIRQGFALASKAFSCIVMPWHGVVAQLVERLDRR